MALGGSIKYQSPTGIDARGDFGGSVSFPPPSHFYLSGNLGALGMLRLSSVTVGLGVNSPFGLNTRYPDDGPFNTAVTSAALQLIDIKPTIAYKVNEDLSIASELIFTPLRVLLGRVMPNRSKCGPGGLGIPSGVPVELYGKGRAAGFTASLLYSPLKNSNGKPLASIGLVYHSQASVSTPPTKEWFYEPHTVVGNLNPTVNGNYHAFVHLGIASLKPLFSRRVG